MRSENDDLSRKLTYMNLSLPVISTNVGFLSSVEGHVGHAYLQ